MPQRGIGFQPKAAELARLPWVTIRKAIQPQRGCRKGRARVKRSRHGHSAAGPGQGGKTGVGARMSPSAPTARLHPSLGQRPREQVAETARAEGPAHSTARLGTHHPHPFSCLPMNRAVGARSVVVPCSWGDAPGWYEDGPLALTSRRGTGPRPFPNPNGIVASSPRLPSWRGYLGSRFGKRFNRNAVVAKVVRV